MPDQTESEILIVAMSVEQRAQIEPWLQDGETVEGFVATAISTELSWRQMTRPSADAAAQEAGR